MAQKIILKNATGAGRAPNTTDLSLGELAINTYDGKLFIKQSNGTDQVIDVTHWSNLSGKPTAFTPEAHTHLKSDITDFNEADYATAAQGLTAESALQALIDDLAPQLGADLDVNGKKVTSGADIVLEPVGDVVFSGTGASVISTDGADDLSLLPGGNLFLGGHKWLTADGTSGQVIQTDAAGNLSFVSVATAADAALAQSALQTGDNVSELVNDANYIDAAGAPVQSVAGKSGAVTLTKSDVGLSNVDNTSDVNKPVSSAQQIALDGKLDIVEKGANNGVAELDSTGKVPASQLPAYVDDVIEVANFVALPATGESGKIYVTIDDNKTYRWSGTVYAEISSSLALGETSTTAFRGDHGKTAYDHSQTIGNPHGVTATDVGLGNVDNTSDVNKPISNDTQTALDLKANAAEAFTGNYGDLTGIPADFVPKTEETQDIVGAMVTGNTESGIAVSYDDVTGKLNFNVSDPTITLSGDVTGSATMTDLGSITIDAVVADNSHSHEWANISDAPVVHGQAAIEDFSAGVITSGTHSGISTSYNATSNELSLTNTDKGSAQNIFKTFTAGGTPIAAGSNADTITFTTGGATTITGNDSDNTIQISSVNTTYSAGSGLSLAGTTFSHADTSSAVSSANGANEVISNITLDAYGHITGHSSLDLSTMGTMSGYKVVDQSGDKVDVNDNDEVRYMGGAGDGATLDINLTSTTGGTSVDPYVLTFTVDNTDKGSDQFIFKTVASDSGSAVADSNVDTLTISGGTGISTSVTGDTLTIVNDAPNVDQTVLAGAGLTGGGTGASITLDVSVAGGIKIESDAVKLDTTSNLNVDHSTVSITGTDGLTGGGNIAASRTISHATSSFSDISNSAGAVISGLTFDAYGHVNGSSSVDLDLRYLTQVDAASDYATFAQGALADSAVQPGDGVSVLTNNAGYLTNSETIDGGTF